MDFTDNEIEHLIKVPKKIIETANRTMLIEGNHRRNDMKLESQDGEYKFSVFMRQNITFQENFSIGLDLIAEGKHIPLVRLNGSHGVFNFDEEFQLSPDKHHFHPHIHKTNEKTLLEKLRGESNAEITEEYVSFKEALVFFIHYTNITNSSVFVDKFTQPGLFERMFN